MGELEDRLARALASMPEAGDAARERTIRATQALAPVGRETRRPMRRRAILALCAATVAVGTGAALAGSGVIEVRVGAPERQPAPAVASKPLAVPPGARGVAVVSGGRLFLRTRSGLGIQGLRVSAAELSPNALYVAVGLGRSLAALSPEGRRAWVQPTGGPVVAASWAPYPIWIAYVVRVGTTHQLRLIEGDGDHDRLVATGVDPARPHWSADGTRLYFSRQAAWWAVAPATGSAPARSVGCGPGCPSPVPVAARTLLAGARRGWQVAAISDPASDPRRQAVVITQQGRHPQALTEAWWTPPRGAGSPRLLMRSPARSGPLQISVR